MRLFLASAVIGVSLVGAGAIKYSGRCLWDLRRADGAQLCEKLFRALNSATAERVLRTGERLKIVAYDSLAQYNSLYPGWCHVESPGYAFGRPTFFDRITGGIAHVVSFNFYARWMSTDGKVETDKESNKAPRFATACGTIWELN